MHLTHPPHTPPLLNAPPPDPYVTTVSSSCVVSLLHGNVLIVFPCLLQCFTQSDLCWRAMDVVL